MNNPFTATSTWFRTLERVIMDGDSVAGQKRGALNSDGTTELLACQSCVDMHFPVMTAKGRGLSDKFMAGEAWWILTGDDRVETIQPYCKQIAQFSDDGHTFFGAYGPRIDQQIWHVLDKLAEDVETRQAVISIWRPNPQKSKDIPCTISVQWLVRNGVIHCVDTMRSSDIWLGWPYDVFNFSMLTIFLALHLRQRTGKSLKLGKLWLNAGSQHLYDRNRDAAFECMRQIDQKHEAPHFAINRWNGPNEFIKFLKDCADGKNTLQ